ncbi:MAG TPA: amidase family protein [Acidimicrobiales bacterium]|nr:amidase family protein [Acidimicrobiales bacterium]
MTDQLLTDLGAGELSERVRSGQCTATELVRAHLDRIERLEPTLHAFRHLRRAAVLAEAESFDARREPSDRPLAGIPVAVSADLAVAGLPNERGSAATSPDPAVRDDPLVAMLRGAGALIVGTTSVAEFGIWPFTEPERAEAPRNPWNTAHSPGGAAGGAAAAVAAGMAVLAVATDGVGGLRVPASCCGLFGLKPGPDLLAPVEPEAARMYGMTTAGPIGRSAEDVGLALDVLAGSRSYRDPLPPPAPLRIAYAPGHYSPAARITPAVYEAVKGAATTLQQAGHRITADRPPYPADITFRFTHRWQAAMADEAEGLPTERLERRTRKVARHGRAARRKATPVADDAFAVAMRRWFQGYDLLITPTLTSGPPPVGSWPRGWLRTMNAVTNWLYTPPWNVAGLPAASLPYDRDEAGLPIGVQLVAPPGGEATLLAVAAQLQALHSWERIAPIGTLPPSH